MVGESIKASRPKPINKKCHLSMVNRVLGCEM